MTTLRPFAALTTCALVVAACGGGGGDDADETTTTAEATTTTSTTEPAPTTTRAPSTTSTTTTVPLVARQPLTGEPLESEDEIIDRAALAVKIDNAPGARDNHTGLAVADIVFEEIVESDLTRFAAVFHTQDSDPLGPIRSGRSQDVDLLTSFDQPLFAWSGGNPGVTRLIRNSTLVDLNAGFTPGYYRGPGNAPHNLYSDTQTLWELTPEDHPGAPPQQYEYLAPGDSFEGEDIAGFDLDVGQIDVQWDWDRADGVWLRSQEGEPHIDKTHGQIAFTNVVVMVVDYQPSSIDRASPEAQTVGEGPAFFFSDGKVVPGRWAREDAVEPISFLDEDGEEPMLLTPGNTWIELPEGIATDDPENPEVELSYLPAP